MAKMELNKLRESVKALFDKASDAETIKRYAAVENEMNELEEAIKRQDEKETNLLKDLKEAYMHTSTKPSNKTDDADKALGGSFNPDEVISNFIENYNSADKK